MGGYEIRSPVVQLSAYRSQEEYEVITIEALSDGTYSSNRLRSSQEDAEALRQEVDELGPEAAMMRRAEAMALEEEMGLATLTRAEYMAWHTILDNLPRLIAD